MAAGLVSNGDFSAAKSLVINQPCCFCLQRGSRLSMAPVALLPATSTLSNGMKIIEIDYLNLAEVALSYLTPSWTTFVAGTFVVVILTLSIYLLFKHLSAYKNPEGAKFLIGVILMVPCYVVESEAIAQSLDACIAHTILGDSLNRNQWKSLVCLVQSAVPRGRRNLSKNGSLCFQNPG
ncbi:unnamed protein product [Camellia sinensis]